MEPTHWSEILFSLLFLRRCPVVYCIVDRSSNHNKKERKHFIDFHRMIRHTTQYITIVMWVSHFILHCLWLFKVYKWEAGFKVSRVNCSDVNNFMKKSDCMLTASKRIPYYGCGRHMTLRMQVKSRQTDCNLTADLA
jgi:hypothetical protein